MSAFCEGIDEQYGIYAANGGVGVKCVFWLMNALARKSLNICEMQNIKSFPFSMKRGMTDDEVLTKAFIENWILITNDKDFGEMIFRERRTHHGVIFLRLDDERAANKIQVLDKLLKNYAEKLPEQFVTVTETKVRIAGA